MTDRLRETDALVEENNAIAHELEVYAAEDEPRVNVHKHLFRLAAALLRRNATTIERQGRALRAVEALCDAAEAEEECGAYVFTDDIREAIALATPSPTIAAEDAACANAKNCK
jgi:hypothetical protein